MDVSDIAQKAIAEISDAIRSVDKNSTDKLIRFIQNARKIYVAGAGRSLLVLRCAAMRLMHLGHECHVVGDTITPAFEEGDLLIAGSASGETDGVIGIARKAKNIGGSVALITARDSSTLAAISDLAVIIPAYTDKVEDNSMKRPTLPGGTLFEQAMLVMLDSVALRLGQVSGVPSGRAFLRHANLE
jgi:6-phospho-3-hexuloisomerase